MRKIILLLLAAITDENRRTATIPLNFLDTGIKYVATIYQDAPNAHWDRNPMAYTIKKMEVDEHTNLSILLVEGGGCAISIKPALQ